MIASLMFSSSYQVTFHLRLILVPTLLLSVMSLAIFWIPPTRPDRTGIGKARILAPRNVSCCIYHTVLRMLCLLHVFCLALVGYISSASDPSAHRASFYYVNCYFLDPCQQARPHLHR